MERKSGLACLVVMMMLCVGGAAGDFQPSSLIEKAKCYAIVYNLCKLTNSTFECIGKASSQCYNATDTDNSVGPARSSSNDRVTPTPNYCELGCAFSRCSNITTTQLNPNLEQLGNCFESCSENTCGGNDEQTRVEFCKLGCAKSICGETADKDTVCGSCDTDCSNISNGHMSHI